MFRIVFGFFTSSFITWVLHELWLNFIWAKHPSLGWCLSLGSAVGLRQANLWSTLKTFGWISFFPILELIICSFIL